MKIVRIAPALLALLAGLQVGGPARAQALRGGAVAPLPMLENFRVYPDFQNSTMVLLWTRLPRATGFEVHRAELGDPLVKIADVAAGWNGYTDATAVATKEYVYRVKVLFAGGLSTWSSAVRQNAKTIWPVPDSHEILHGWNDTLGTATNNDTGFHVGVDIQRSGPDNDVVATRGGIVSRVAGPAANQVVDIWVKGELGAWARIQTNHCENVVVSEGQSVYAGQKLGEVSEAWFHDDFDHVHFCFLTAAGTFMARHPLQIFTSVSDKDPGNVAPGLVDHDGGGSVLFRRDGGGPELPGGIVHGDVDVIVELADAMGTDPDQNPVLLDYWIEPRAPVCGVGVASVKDALAPYSLFRLANQYLGAGEVNQSVADQLIDKTRNWGGTIPNYPWPNYKHYVLTNTKGTDGLKANIDASQHWNTNAKQDGASPLSAHANYAGKPDATRPSEARFPDGDYTVHVIARDLVNANADIEFEVRVENFPPVVCMTDPFPGEVLPAGTDEVSNLEVFFNEPMDTTVPATGLLVAHGGASVHDAFWLDASTIRFTLKDMVDGGVYTVRVLAAAKDRPGAPGGNPLDGNDDGTGGDDHTWTFSVAP